MSHLRLRTRLTLWYCGVLAVVLAAFAITVMWQQGRIGMRRVDRELDRLAATVSGLLADELSESDTPAQASKEVVATLAAAGRFVTIAGADGRVIVSTLGGPVIDVAGEATQTSGETRALSTTADGQWRLFARRDVLKGDTYIIVASAPMADATRERAEALEAMWLAGPVLILVAAFGGYWLATAALRPISEMATRAAALPVDAGEDLGQSGRDDELGTLETAFNGLVKRLRASLQAQRQFMADAAHELRTPVSVIRSVSDVTLDRQHRDESEYREALELVGVQAQHVGRVLDDMLMLARADAGGYALNPRPLYLNEVAQECCAALRSVAQARNVVVDAALDDDVLLNADEDLLRRMLLNLVQNAVQHSPSAGEVRVDVERTRTCVRIVVRDQGAGVPAADRERIFDRFVQLDPARRRAGAGLGLPISRWIAELHGGTLELLESSSAGSTFLVTLPISVTE